jgi:glycosyltransferase involved in cell wall biosynthesis
MRLCVASDLDYTDSGKGPDGSPQRLTIEHYAARGDNVTFITSATPTLRENKNDRHHDRGLRFVRLDSPTLNLLAGIRKIGWFAKAAAWLIFQVRLAIFIASEGAKSFDVFYAYEIFPCPVMKLLSAMNRKPLVTRFQGTVLRAEMSLLDRLRQWQHVVALRISSDLTIMTNDGTEGDKVIRALRGSSSGVQFLINGIDPIFFEIPLKADRSGSDALVVYCCGRLVQWKNHDRSIRVVAEAIRRGANVRLLVIGDGPDRPRLQQLAESLGVASRVEFIGAIPHIELVRFIEKADVYLSNYDLSNFGKTMMEAMAGGRAIVTTDVGDTRSFVVHGTHGFVSGDNDIGGMADALVRLEGDRALAAMYGANARASARKHFWSWDERLDYERELVVKLVGTRRQ